MRNYAPESSFTGGMEMNRYKAQVFLSDALLAALFAVMVFALCVNVVLLYMQALESMVERNKDFAEALLFSEYAVRYEVEKTRSVSYQHVIREGAQGNETCIRRYVVIDGEDKFISICR